MLVSLMVGFMKYAFEMVSCGVIYIPTFVNNGSGIQNLLDRHTQISQAYFYCFKGSDLKFGFA
jgi:hypothetical protein